MTSHPGKSFCLLLFCCDLLGEKFHPVALLRSQKETLGNGGPEFPRQRNTECGCSLRLQCKRTRSGRESLRRGLGRSPPTHPVPSRSHNWPTRASGWVGRSPSTSAEKREEAFVLYYGAHLGGRSALYAALALFAAVSACSEICAHLLLASASSRYFSGLGDGKV